MKVEFLYNKEKDIWCLLNKGKSSNNSNTSTLVYQELVSEFGENPDEAVAASFVDKYLEKHSLNVDTVTTEYQKKFDELSPEFQKRAEKVFGTPLNKELKAYLTINNRCPYSTEEGWFFVSMTKANPSLTMMHELWHFYTWQRFGNIENDVNEALTVLLNIECGDLLGEGVKDTGYPQHQELRGKIEKWWSENSDIQYVFDMAKQYKN